MMGETNMQNGDKLCVVHMATGTEVWAAPHQNSPHVAAAGLRAGILNRESIPLWNLGAGTHSSSFWRQWGCRSESWPQGQ